MRQHTITFATGDLARLTHLIGGSWLYVAGETLTHHLNTPVDVIVGTTHGSVRIVSETVEAAFAEEGETYASLSISADVSGFETAKRNGNVYVHHQRERILDVLILRETIIEIEDGRDIWSYTTDIGIVFVLSGGAIAVTKGSHHTEMLVVRMARSVGELDLPDRCIEWEDDLMITHRVERQFIPIAGLVAREQGA